MHINAKKLFEFFLILIIFFGVYSAFEGAAHLIFDNPKTFWIVIVSLIVAALLLLLYSAIVASSAKKQLKQKVSELEGSLKTKDEELKNAFKVKRAVEEEAEESILKEEAAG